MDYDGYLYYADQTAEIVQNLIGEKIKNGIGHDYEAIPLLFFFRHCLELYLKGFNYYLNSLGCNIIISKNNHDIIAPFNEILKMKSIFRIRHPNSDVKSFIELIGKLDPKGQGWRYPESSDGTYNKKQEEFAVSIKYDKTNQVLNNIKETLDWCINVEGDLNTYKDSLTYNKP